MFDLSRLQGLYDLGGPVVAVLVGVSVLTFAVVLYKLWQFRAARVGQHAAIRHALMHWDAGARDAAQRDLDSSRSYLAPVVARAMSAPAGPDRAARLYAEAESRFLALERGFRSLDSVAQLAPLMGLFGTVLGMIEAFQALQNAGSSVDPSLLAGGIWVALLTTAVGLAVAMPTSIVLSWFEARMTGERVFAEQALTTILAPAEDAVKQVRDAA
ncbi:MotA/TolQ/ExbB proton channel family protein [Pseudosulfitobacter sp. DSM 107133]|uniref:MotA/TolQ/ExbB proton channel family protein n=1 Tax=Pseudosulfitobacter sp. DSM 107133 TaxID=2883100 RepID=UPI000DF27BAF|nr:MotA/TolQ/ExbB proton channel family protein [Pseudosulfitobacter sp. DSM 107133]UOA27828.1 Biopolymer transport protein ExbB [Pseudosulfitobacter sp. DSM 107133]